MIGLYIHIPFCNHICAYCDFYKMVASNQLKEKTIDYIIKEMDERAISKYNIDTIYIGGGSPGSLTEELSVKLFSAVLGRVNIFQIKEFSIELNPNDINLKYALLLKKFGVNRVSIGVQSFNKKIIEKLGRNPFVNYDEIKEKIAILKSVGITNINLDLIYGIDGETIEDLEDDLQKAVSLDITHLSCYSLILEEHTILNYQYKMGKYKLIDENLEALMYEKIKTNLRNAGFIHYETSNFARKNYECLHNLKYWKNTPYLAVGPSGAGFIDDTRYTNTTTLNDYFLGLASDELKYNEYLKLNSSLDKEITLMMNLRLLEGININDWKGRFNEDIVKSFPNIPNLINEHLLEEINGFLKIPSKYFYISNYIITKIL